MSNLRYAPEARILVDGQPMAAALRASVTSVSLQLGLQGADRLELQVADDALRFIDHPQLALGRDLQLSIGYAPDPLEQVFVGDVVSLTPAFPSSGAPTLTIAAHDRRARLQRGTKKRWFALALPRVGPTPVPDPAVAASVAAEHALLVAADAVSVVTALALGGIEYGLNAIFGKGAVELVRKQEGESDLALLERLAAENGWMMSMDHSGSLGGNVIRFSSLLTHVVPDVTFRYGESLLDFSPRLTTVGEIVSVTARFWVPEAKVEMTVTAAWNWDRQALEVTAVPSSGKARGSTSGATRKPAAIVLGEAVSPKTASRRLLAKLFAKLNERLTGSASIVGDPRLRPGQVVQIDGVGAVFGGPYRITSVKHTLDTGGFRTSFDVRKEVWFDGAHLMRGVQGSAQALLPTQPFVSSAGIS